MSFLKEEIKAGLIVCISIIALSIFVILIGGTQLFEKLDTYHIKLMNAAGVEEGAQVRIGGVKAGRVLSIKTPAAAGEPIDITIGLKQGTVLYKGTKALISQVGFVGDVYLLLSVENTVNERIPVGDVIPSEEQVQFAKLMARLDVISQSVDTLLKDIHLVFSQKNIKEVENILHNANAAIVSGSANIDKVAQAVRDATAKLERTLGEVESLVGSNKAEVSLLIRRARENIEKAGDMVKTIEAAAKSADKTMKTADRAIDQQSQNLDVLMNSLNRATEDLRDVLHEVKTKPWSFVYKEGKVEK